MQHPIVPYAHAAYCTGYAASGATVGESTAARRNAAIRYAIEQCDHPDVIEATLHLGHLDGVWANIYKRREELYNLSLKDFASAWSDVYDDGRDDELINAVRMQTGPDGNSKLSDAAITYAAALITLIFQGFMRSAQWNQVRLALGTAMVSAYATGEADSLELLADQAGRIGFDFDKAFQAAQDKFESIPGMLDGVDQFIGLLFGAVALNTARTLVKMAHEGASPEEMKKYLAEQLHKGTAIIFIAILDNFIHSAITFGILWFLRNAGATQVWFITAGDEKVCAVCDEVEGNNPYSIIDAPECPQHVNCRCTLYTENLLDPSLLNGLVD